MSALTHPRLPSALRSWMETYPCPLRTIKRYVSLLSQKGPGEEGEGGTATTDPAVAQPIRKRINTGNNAVRLYPNPSGNVAKLSFSLKEEGAVTVTLSDLNGKVLKEIVKGEHFIRGGHEVAIATECISNGIYMLHFESREEKTTLKMSIIK